MTRKKATKEIDLREFDIVADLNPKHTATKTTEERISFLEKALRASESISCYDHLQLDTRVTALIVAVVVEAIAIAGLFFLC